MSNELKNPVCIQNDDGTYTTPIGRMSFPKLWKTEPNLSGKMQFSLNFVLDPDKMRAVRRILIDAIKSRWGEDKSKWPGILGKVDLKTYCSPTAQDGWPIRDGNLVNWEGAEGMEYLRVAANEDYPPQIIDTKKNEIFDKSLVYGGRLCKLVVTTYAYDNVKSGANLSLSVVVVGPDDGVRYGGGKVNIDNVDIGEDDDWGVPVEAATGADDW